MAKKNLFVSDFETTTFLNDCRVWAWAMADVYNSDFLNYGNNIETFLDHIQGLPNNSTVFFHNLKFDGQFIANKLLHLGFKWARSKADQFKNNYFQFTVSKTGVWYSGFVKFSNGVRIKFVDSLKKIPFRVKDIAVAFDLDMMKGDLDYKAYRSKNHLLTEEEKKYIDNDIKIVAEAVKIQYEEGMTGNTVSSDSLKDLKMTIGKSKFENLFPMLSNEMYYNLKLAYRGGQTYVNKPFKNKELGEGIVFDVNSQYPWAMREKPMPCGLPVFFEGKYKKNKRYPLFIQHIRCEFKLKENHIPTIQIKGDSRFRANEFLESSKEEAQVDLYLTNVDYELFHEHYHVYNETFIDGHMFKSITGAFNKYIDKYMYQKANSDGALRALAKLKLNSVYGKFGADPDVTGKIMYLKEDGSNGFRSADRVEYITETGRKKTREVEELKEYGDSVYIPVAIFTTSYGRELIVRTAQKVYHRFAYCDTDSIHLIGTEIPHEIEDMIHPKKLGYWKLESTFAMAKFIRQKTYIENTYARYKRDKQTGQILYDRFGEPIIDECSKEEHEFLHLNVKCAGMPENVKKYVTVDNFHVGAEIKAPLKRYPYKGKIKQKNPIKKHTYRFVRYELDDKKLVPKQVKGGVVLVGQTFTIKEGGFFGY